MRHPLITIHYTIGRVMLDARIEILGFNPDGSTVYIVREV